MSDDLRVPGWRRPKVPADPVMPRIDTVIERGDETQLLVGTPALGATLANRRGSARVPEGWEAKHFILIGAGATTLTEAHVMRSLWTADLNAAVERIEAEIPEI